MGGSGQTFSPVNIFSLPFPPMALLTWGNPQRLKGWGLCPGSLSTHNSGSSPLKSPGAQPPRLSPILQPQKQPSGASLERISRGHNLCPPCPSSDFRSPPAVSHLPRGQGSPFPSSVQWEPSLYLSKVPGWVLRGTGAAGEDLETGRPGAGPPGIYSCLSIHTGACLRWGGSRGLEGLVPAP